LSNSQAIVTKNRVYMIGGSNGTSFISTVYYATINADGTLGTWLTGTDIPTALAFAQAIITKNKVYLIGGGTTVMDSSTVYVASINSDGTLGAWTTGPTLPGKVSHHQCAVTKNRVYVLGGWNSTTLSTIYSSLISEDGTLGSWVTETSLPVGLVNSSIVVFKNTLYLIGSGTSTLQSSFSTVYTAPINSDGTLGKECF
jgi:N-acetylneuraminic acid mutarotase